MKTRNKFFISIIAIMLSCVIMFTAIAVYGNTNKSGTVSASTRTVELSESTYDAQSIFEQFEEPILTTIGSRAAFIGYQTYDSSIFEEFENISINDANNNQLYRVRYETTFDKETNEIVLAVIMENNGEILIDYVKGISVFDENNNFDIVFENDGDIILLSELMANDAVDNCGFFSALKKVWNTTIGKIGMIVTTVACVAVGVVCAVVPGGQLVTAVMFGAVVGAAGFAATAGFATYYEEGEIDWEAVLACGTTGAVVGAISSAIGYGVGCLGKYLASKSASSLKYGDKFGKLGEYCKNPNIKVNWSQATPHAVNRMAERGMSQKAVESIVKHGKTFAQNGSKFLFVTKDGAAVVDASGKLITAYPSSCFDSTMIELIKLLGLI